MVYREKTEREGEMTTDIKLDTIKQREMLLKKGIPDKLLMCKHLWSGETQKSSKVYLFGVELCEECAKKVTSENN